MTQNKTYLITEINHCPSLCTKTTRLLVHFHYWPVLSTVCTWKTIVAKNVKDFFMFINDALEVRHAFLYRLPQHAQYTRYKVIMIDAIYANSIVVLTRKFNM